MKISVLIAVVTLFTGVMVSPLVGEVRPPAVAGSFYPADSAQLASMVRDHLAKVAESDPVDDELIALIVPHAGFVYSGSIAAHAYKLLGGSRIDRVIMCGPSHRYRFQGVSVYGPEVVWKTPLGSVTCDRDLCNRLLDQNRLIAKIAQAHSQEHSLEVQLPYLQTVLDDFAIVPVVMGGQDRATIDLLAEALISLNVSEKSVMIASTDWQHFHSAAEGWPMDSLGIECVKTLDVGRLERLVLNRTVEACGGGPTVAVLKAAVARGANKVRILKYGDSGDVSGDKSSVVGYLAAAIYRAKDGDDAGEPSLGETTGPSSADRSQLLQIARRSIKAHLAGEVPPEFEVSPFLMEPGAAFVTLNKHDRLRGCIGYTVAAQPLYQTVSECAVQAAVGDRRFPPVTSSELSELEIEISVLTPLQVVESLDEIEVGRDGLMISMGNRRGLLLPQVATDYGWSRTEFLQQTCRKAGLPPDTYLSTNATIYRFQAIVFGEEEEG